MTPYPKDELGDDMSSETSQAAARFGQAGIEGTIDTIRQQGQVAVDALTRQVQQHPLRTLAIVGGIGFVLASSLRRGVLPAMLKSGLGVAAAVALRQAAERGLLGGMAAFNNDTQSRPD